MGGDFCDDETGKSGSIDYVASDFEAQPFHSGKLAGCFSSILRAAGDQSLRSAWLKRQYVRWGLMREIP